MLLGLEKAYAVVAIAIGELRYVGFFPCLNASHENLSRDFAVKVT